MWSLKFVYSLRDRKLHRSARHSGHARVTLNLEALEERWLPNGAFAAPSTPPPSFIQAATALYLDGYMEGLDPFFDPQNVPAAINANIAYYSPYAGPFAPLFVLAGQMAHVNSQQATAQDLASSSAFLPNNPNGF
jgi:hypothetical protein